MNMEDYKLKLQNFWRHNEKLIILIAGAFVLGVLIAGLNYWNHQNATNIMYTDETQVITNEDGAVFFFSIDEPQLAQNTEIDFVFENVDRDTALTIYINNERVDEANSNTESVTVDSEILEEENTVGVRRESIGFEDQALVSASVTSSTNFQQLIFVVTNLTAIILVAAPLMYVKYTQYVERKKIEQKFPEFLRDVVEGTRAGMSLPQAIKSTNEGSYGALDKHIEKMTAQLDWGIPFDQVLKTFGKETKSPLIKRSVDTIIQAYESGGNVQDVLESVGENIRSIKTLKQQRESQLYGEMITGYVVYFIFIGILIALNNFLLPNLAGAQEALGGSDMGVGGIGEGGEDLQDNINLYNTWFQRLVFIQGLFSGLIIGKLSEGELKAGLKHTAILFALGYLAVTFFL